MSLQAILSSIPAEANSFEFRGRTLPVASFDWEHIRRFQGGQKRRRKVNRLPGVVAPFQTMTEESRVRVLGNEYWREGNVVAEFLVRESDAILIDWNSKLLAFGLFKCFAHFHGGHPFHKELPVLPNNQCNFPSDCYCWGASIIAVPNYIAYIGNDKYDIEQAEKRIKQEYDRYMKRPRGTADGDLRYINCENLEFASCE